MAKRLFALVLALCAVVATSGAAADDLLTPEALRQELEFIHRTILEVHPDVSRSISKEGFDWLYEEIAGQITAPLTRGEFRLLAGRLTAAIGDGHTSIFDMKGGDGLPLRLRWVSDGLVVFASTEGAGVEAGDRVIAIGGRTPEEILKDLAPSISADNPYWLKERASVLFVSGGVLRALGLVGPDESVDFRVEQADGAVTERRIRLGTVRPPQPGSRAYFGFTVSREESLGVFYLDRCQDKDDYRKAVDEFFTRVRDESVRTVVLDLRENGGGSSSVVHSFLKYLPPARIKEYGVKVRFSWAMAQQRGITSQLRPAEVKPRMVANRRPSRKDLLFRGRVYVLTSPRTFSSAVMMATQLKDNDLVTVVGEPTGGAPSHFGEALPFELKATGLELDVSCKAFTRPDPSRDPADALYPDVLVPTTVQAIRQGLDPQLEWVKAEAEKGVAGQ